MQYYLHYLPQGALQGYSAVAVQIIFFINSGESSPKAVIFGTLPVSV
jgi:hypothetical protein